MTAEAERTIADLVFAGFNRRVVAVDRYSGDLVWTWKAPEGSGFVSVLVDGDRLVVGVNGYLYCLDPLFGQLVWRNRLKGLGTGIMSLGSARGQAESSASAAAAAAAQAAAAAAAAGAAGAT
ncbi:MAG: outer membrane protein assembly factor BamB family protein [Planctomycetota bacterium]|jgi:outer membrane protein assembly factor BamB